MCYYTTGVSLHFVRTSSPGSAGSTPWGSSGSHGTNEKELARKENGKPFQFWLGNLYFGHSYLIITVRKFTFAFDFSKAF